MDLQLVIVRLHKGNIVLVKVYDIPQLTDQRSGDFETKSMLIEWW